MDIQKGHLPGKGCADRRAGAPPGEAASGQSASAVLTPAVRRASLRERARYRAVQALLGVSSVCPLRVLRAVAGGLAPLANLLPLRGGRVARANVRACFPELSPAERRGFVVASLAQSMFMVAELGHLWRRPIEEVLARVVEVRGVEHFERALGRGRGVLVASPHLGAWELTGLWFAARCPMTTLYRAPRVSALERIYSSGRSRSGARLFPADASGLRAMYRALARGEVVGLLPDQDPGRGKGVFAPFFGLPANTSALLPRIAASSQASVLFTFAERLPACAGYRIHIRPGSEEIGAPDLERAVCAVNRDVEACVRAAPLQYLWTYKRFRARPPGGADLYGKPTAVRS